MQAPLAIMCSGQGAQHRAMFDLFSSAEAAQPIFEQAASVLGEDPRGFVKHAPFDKLLTNRNGQLLCCTQAMAAWAVLKPALPRKLIIAGYSVGELSAWGCAGMLSPEQILSLAVQRAVVMDAASPADGGLAGIVGLRQSDLSHLFDNRPLSIAIVNGIDSFVVGGYRPDLEVLCERAHQQGAKRTVMLPVEVPSHTPLLKHATEQFADILKHYQPQLPVSGRRLLAGLDGDTLWSVDMGKQKLSQQISTTIHWSACMESCKAGGATVALELGPGTSLARMAGAFFPLGNTRSIDEFKTLPGIEAWLERVHG